MDRHVGTDWEALKFEFVNGAMSYRELAQKHGLKTATVQKQGERHHWMDQRRQLSAKVGQIAQATLLHKRADALEEVNEADLAIAWRMRTWILQRLNDAMPLSAGELRLLASAALLAQKISHLAIGVTTAKRAQEHAGQDNGPIAAVAGTFVLTDEQRAAADEILNYFINGSKV